MRAAGSSGRGFRTAGILLIIAGGAIYAALGGAEEAPSSLLGAIVMIGGVLLHFRGRQYAARARLAAADDPLADSKPDVLYLRSFRSDTSSSFQILMSGLTTEEEQLADVLWPFGNLIAIGRPGEALPVPGASRLYTTDAEWKRVVSERMRSASLVVIRAGTGSGLVWELSQAVTALDPARVLIFVFRIRGSEYAAFADQARSELELRLPHLEPSGLVRMIVGYREGPSSVRPGFITFADDWKAAFHPLPLTFTRIGYNDFRKPFSIALRPLFERRGVPWHRVGRFGA